MEHNKSVPPSATPPKLSVVALPFHVVFHELSQGRSFTDEGNPQPLSAMDLEIGSSRFRFTDREMARRLIRAMDSVYLEIQLKKLAENRKREMEKAKRHHGRR